MTYESTILADSPSYYWELGEASGSTAADSASTNTGTYQGTNTLGQTGIPGSLLTADLLDGSTAYISTTTSISNPTVYSLEAWFKTANAYGSGGTLFSFGSTQTGFAASNDRYLWLADNGTLHFNMGTNAGAAVASSGSYNDGNWHHVVATASNTAGSAIYVDTVSATNSSTVGLNNYSGFWRMGDAAATNYWTASTQTAPTSTHLAATFGQLVVYSVVLSSSQVTAHYNAGAGVAAPGEPFVPQRMPLGV